MKNSNMLPRMIIFIIFITMLTACGSQNTVQPGNTAPASALSALKPKSADGAQASPQAIVTGTTKTAVPAKEAEPDDNDGSSVQEPDIAPISEDQ